MKTQNYVAGWNYTGCLFEGEPAIFEDQESAKDYILEMLQTEADSIESGSERETEAEEIEEMMQDINLESGEFSYFVKPLNMWFSVSETDQLTEEQEERQEEISALFEDQPAWITQPLNGYDVAAIVQGGCASGAYMPAVTYYQAKETMNEHGDDVLEAIESFYGEIPQPDQGGSWGGIAVFYLSLAVELYAQQLYSKLEDLDVTDAEMWEMDN